MLQYYYHLIAIFTLTSVLVIYATVLGLIMKVSRLHVYVSGFTLHSLRHWSEMRKTN